MDTFLQLVPIEGVDDTDPALVYGEADDIAGTDGHDAIPGASVEHHDPHFLIPLRVDAGRHSPLDTVAAIMRERCLGILEELINMQQEELAHLDHRIDLVGQIGSLSDREQQVAQYLPTMKDWTTNSDRNEEARVRLAAELLECANQLCDPDDAEVCLVAAFVFSSESSRDNSQQHSSPILAAIAALLDDSHGVEHHTC